MATDETREIQEKLRAISLREGTLPEISVDGVYGPLTSLSVSAFQQQNDLPVTGEVNYETWLVLNDEYERVLFASKQPDSIAALECNIRLRYGSTGSNVFLLQTMLRYIGEQHYNIGGVVRNGIYDDNTMRAMREYQRAAGLKMTGETDKATWDALAPLYNYYFEQVCK